MLVKRAPEIFVVLCEELAKQVAKVIRHAIDQDCMDYFEAMERVINDSIKHIGVTKVSQSRCSWFIVMYFEN